jgi:hypothetical protein
MHDSYAYSHCDLTAVLAQRFAAGAQQQPHDTIAVSHLTALGLLHVLNPEHAAHNALAWVGATSSRVSQQTWARETSSGCQGCRYDDKLRVMG